MVVSLEAIFLSTFVLISQNRLSEETERRADLDLHIGLLTEHELTRVLQMLDAIQDKLGIIDHANSDLADLEMETRPEDVLAEIHRLQVIELGQRERSEQRSRPTLMQEKGDPYSDIFDAAIDGLIITDLKTCRVLEANPAACAMHGCTRAEFIGQLPKIFIHPDRQHVFSKFLRVFYSGVTIRYTCFGRKPGYQPARPWD